MSKESPSLFGYVSILIIIKTIKSSIYTLDNIYNNFEWNIFYKGYIN